MQIRWSPGGAEDLDHSFHYIARDSRAAAQRVVQGIYARAEILSAFPYLGRTGRVNGTRELPLTPLPYIIMYRALGPVDAVEIVSVIHAAQCWPPLA
jgi:plasmid stabilization system protein ParE